MTGFGSAMVAVPMLVQFIPLQVAVPLVVLFDLVATSMVGGKNWGSVSTLELKHLLPPMLLGIAIGVVVIHNVGPRWPLVGLGVFVLVVSVRNLLASGS
ncbi:TSUP family transporter, partial [Variovorax sp. 2RAF20]